MTIASIAYNKVVIIATFLDGTQSSWTTQLWCGGNFLACQQALLGLSGLRGWEICLLWLVFFPNLCQWQRSFCSNLGGINLFHTKLSFYFFGAYFRMYICLITLVCCFLIILECEFFWSHSL